MRFYLLTLGCPKNEVDSDAMFRYLEGAGHLPVQKPGEADLLLVKTCGFIDPARKESISALAELAEIKAPHQTLIAAGCLSELYGERLKKEVPGIDYLLAMDEETSIVRVISDRKLEGVPAELARAHAEPARTTSYLKISDGCNAACGFCLIPSIKGPYRSVPRDVVLSEAERLVGGGAKELILIGQDTSAYGLDRGEKDGLADLISSILERVPELHWLRIMYLYPSRVSEKLFQVMADYPQVCHYVDMPLQHAHPEVLRRMNRPHDMDRLRGFFESLRAAMPDIALRTSFIVGYPGETEEEFQAILDFMTEMRFDHVGAFTYSKEKGTAAALLGGQVPQRIKRKRFELLMLHQQRLSLESNRRIIGKTIEVLVESLDDDGLAGGKEGFVGRSYRDAPEVDGLVFARGTARLGEIAPVRITRALEYDVIGESLDA